MIPAGVDLVTIRYQILALELAARWVSGIAIIATVTLWGVIVYQDETVSEVKVRSIRNMAAFELLMGSRRRPRAELVLILLTRCLKAAAGTEERGQMGKLYLPWGHCVNLDTERKTMERSGASTETVLITGGTRFLGPHLASFTFVANLTSLS